MQNVVKYEDNCLLRYDVMKSGIYQCIRGTCCLHHQGNLKMEAAYSSAAASKMLVNIYQVT
jgi:hypothetical protein